MKGPFWHSKSEWAECYRALNIAKESIYRIWRGYAKNYRKFATNQNGMSMGVRYFDLGLSNLSAQLKAFAAAIRFSDSSCGLIGRRF